MEKTRTKVLEGRKREEEVVELRNVAHHKQALARWRGGRGRSQLVSFKSWHITNEHSQTGGGKREERVGELRNVARHKRALTSWRGGRGRSGLVSFETWHVTNEHSPNGGEEEGGAGW